jgi:hypothetical protein
MRATGTRGVVPMTQATRFRDMPRISARVIVALLVLVAVLAPAAVRAPSRAVHAALIRPIFSRPPLHSPIRIRLSVGADHLRLNDGRDYILIMPARKKTGVLEIRGGRNIRVVGGYISVSRGDANIIIADGSNARRGRIVHLEGLLIDSSGGASADGVRINAPRAIVQIVLCRIVGLKGSRAGVHADVVQPFGGVRALRIDGLTASSHYNGLYLRRENYPLRAPIRRVRIRHTNIIGLWNGSGREPEQMLRGISIGTQPRDPGNDDSPVNCQMSGRVILRGLFVKPARKRPGQFVYPHDSMQRAGCAAKRSKDGTRLRWPALRDHVDGAVRIGAPPGGDFVPAARVGLNYRAGYA